MDQVTKSFLASHKIEFSIEDWNEQDAFEHFVNHCIINKYTTERFDPADLMTKPGEVGIDGIAICINNHLVSTLDEFEDINKQNMDVRFVFTQSKTSDRFDGNEIGTFISGVKSFFAPVERRLKTNSEIEALIAIKDKIYENSINFKQTPVVEMYYVCCGKWQEGNNLLERINLDIEPLRSSPDFSDVLFYPYDAVKIQTAYRELKKKISKQFSMDKKVAFSQIDGVRQAYIGLVKCKEFVSLLTDSEGKMLTNIFEDNVRDFQGYNQVNSEILETIEDNKDQHRFAILNNGITVVAKHIDVEGDMITIHDYQIVNGCQTSCVLFYHKDLLDEYSSVVLKIIEISESEISDRVIYTTNRQTEVKSEAFISTSTFQKGLEAYYNAVQAEYRLYYERRSKQYNLNDNIKKDRVVTIPNQIQSYMAMFLNEPQSVHRYYGELLSKNHDRLFKDGDSYELYYIASYYQYRINSMFRKGIIDKKYQLLKPYILFAMRLLISEDKIVIGNSKSQEKTAKRFWVVIKDEVLFYRYQQTALSCLDESLREITDVPENSIHRSKELTNVLIAKCKKINSKIASEEFLDIGHWVNCVVQSVNDSFVNVAIKTTDQRKYGSIHISKVAIKYIMNLRTEVQIGSEFQAKIIGPYDNRYGWEMSLIE